MVDGWRWWDWSILATVLTILLIVMLVAVLSVESFSTGVSWFLFLTIVGAMVVNSVAWNFKVEDSKK
jgi:hypothetical protein